MERDAVAGVEPVTLDDGVGADDEFVAAVEGELPRLRRVARMLVGDPEMADDLVGEAIARTLPRSRAGEVRDVGAYLRQTMVNLAARRWRRRLLARRRDHAALDWLAASVDDSEVVAERDHTLRAVMDLPVRRRAVVVLRFYEDLSLREIATTLDISEGTVKSQLSRGLEQLRAVLGDQEGS